MGWTFDRDWKSRRDVLEAFKFEIEAMNAGVTVTIEGSWAYAERNGDPVDLFYLLVQKLDGEWGYKYISLSYGPLCYSAPLWMVLKVHGLLRKNEYYLGWLEKYPKRKTVLLNDSHVSIVALFQEAS